MAVHVPLIKEADAIRLVHAQPLAILHRRCCSPIGQLHLQGVNHLIASLSILIIYSESWAHRNSGVRGGFALTECADNPSGVAIDPNLVAHIKETLIVFRVGCTVGAVVSEVD